MIRWKRPIGIRVRLTLWYTGAMVVVLGLYAIGVFAFVRTHVSQGLDERLHEDFYWAAEMLDKGPDGTISWPQLQPDDSSDVAGSPRLQVWSPKGELLYRTADARRNPIPGGDELAARADGSIVTIPQAVPPVRVLSNEWSIGGQPVVLQVARPEDQMSRQLDELSFILLLSLPIGVAAASLGGYSLARRALAPIDRMAERARSITAERLRERLPVDNPNDEVGKLASVFNETLTRLEGSFEQMRRFTADASHELRTPLTAMRSVGEVGLRGKRDERGYREIIGSMLEEVERLARLVDRLLTLSRADNGEVKLSIDVVDLCDLASEVATQLDVLAEEKQQSVMVEQAADLVWMGDRLILRQALLNLVDNAIKYSPVGGRITIRVAQGPTGAIVDVTDTGPGIPPELRRKIFDRFYRLDKARSRDNGGTGLGLSIARWAVEVNGGQLALEPETETGSTFRITLPGASSNAMVASSLRSN